MSFDTTTREVVLSRDGHRCKVCGSVEKLEAHHIVPTSRGGPNTENNGITLCRWCHDKTKLYTGGCVCPMIEEGRCDYWRDDASYNDVICNGKWWGGCRVFLSLTQYEALEIKKQLKEMVAFKRRLRDDKRLR